MSAKNTTNTGDYARPIGRAAAGDTIPFMIDDTYHLFQLGSPPNTVHHPARVRCSWVRQRSRDLVDWTRDSDFVLSPGTVTTDLDRDGCWTGSAVVGPDGNMHIFYTGYNLAENGKQVILHAKSSDRQGSKFVRPEVPIALDASSSLDRYEATDFRDPYVFFNEAEGLYWMLVATRFSEGPYWTRGCVALLTSPNLERWSVDEQPLCAPNNIFCPECPELFTLGNGKWYLVYSKFSAPQAGTLYMIGDTPRGPWRSPRDSSGGRFDGRRWYAAKSCPKAGDPSKRVSFAWVHDYNQSDGKWLWGGTLTQPREISAAADGTLIMTPSLEVLEALTPISNEKIESFPSNLKLAGIGTTVTSELPLSAVPAGATQVVSFNVESPDAKSFGLLLGYDDDLRGYKLSIEQVAGEHYSVTLVTDLPPLDDFWADLTSHQIPRLVDGAELVRHGAVKLDQAIQLFLTEDVVEFFFGGKVVTYRLPAREKKKAKVNGAVEPTVKTIGLYVEDGTVTFTGFKFSQLLGGQDRIAS